MGVPSGRVHTLTNLACYAALAAGTLLLGKHLEVTPTGALGFSLAYAAGTWLLSPDLDLADGHVDAKRHWGPLGVLWVPYGLLFSHRGLSHTWLLGPLTRLAYLAALLGLLFGLGAGLLGVLGRQAPAYNLGWPTHPGALLPALAGYYLSQWLHLALDGIRPDHGLRRGGRQVRGALRRLR